MIRFTPEERLLSDNMTAWWTDFAKHGRPSSYFNNDWPAYIPSTHERIVITTDPPEYISSYKASQCEVWKEYYDLYYPTTDSDSLKQKMIDSIQIHLDNQLMKVIL